MDRVIKVFSETVDSMNPNSNGFDNYLDRGMIKLMDGCNALYIANYVFVELSPYITEYAKLNRELLEALKREHQLVLNWRDDNGWPKHDPDCPVCQLIRRCEQ